MDRELINLSVTKTEVEIIKRGLIKVYKEYSEKQLDAIPLMAISDLRAHINEMLKEDE